MRKILHCFFFFEYVSHKNIYQKICYRYKVIVV